MESYALNGNVRSGGGLEFLPLLKAEKMKLNESRARECGLYRGLLYNKLSFETNPPVGTNLGIGKFTWIFIL